MQLVDLVDLEYAYANARVKALKDKLFDKHRMRELMDVRSLPEVVEMLEESPYKKAFVKASTKYSGLELVKRALDDDLKLAFHNVWKFAPAKARPVLSLLLKQWEVNNLKKAVAAKALGKKVSMDEFLVVEGEDAKLLEKVVSAEGLEGASAALGHSEYGEAFRKAFEECERSSDFRVLLSSLDDYYFARLAKEVFFGGLDGKTRVFLKRKLEYAGALAILRMRSSGMHSSRVRKFLARGPMPETRLLRKMVDAASVEAAVEILAGGKYVDRKALEEKFGRKDLAGVEVELEKALLVSGRKTLSSSVLSLGALVGYLFLKQEEVHSLRKIAYATQFDVKQEIRETVLAAV